MMAEVEIKFIRAPRMWPTMHSPSSAKWEIASKHLHLFIGIFRKFTHLTRQPRLIFHTYPQHICFFFVVVALVINQRGNPATMKSPEIYMYFSFFTDKSRHAIMVGEAQL